MIGSSLAGRRGSQYDYARQAREQVHVTICNFFWQMFCDFHTDRYVERAIVVEDTPLQIEFRYIKPPGTAIPEGRLGVLESEYLAALVTQRFQQRAGTAPDVDNGPGLEVIED